MRVLGFVARVEDWEEGVGVRPGVIQGRRLRSVFTSPPCGEAAPAAQRPRRWGVAAAQRDWEEGVGGGPRVIQTRRRRGVFAAAPCAGAAAAGPKRTGRTGGGGGREW